MLDTDLILIVDDDADILEFGAEILQTLGYDVLIAHSGLEAAAILRKNSRVSILFTDIQMPGMGGEELAQIALAIRPHIHVIFTSGYNRPRADVPFLHKPYKTIDLLIEYSCHSKFHYYLDRGGLEGTMRSKISAARMLYRLGSWSMDRVNYAITSLQLCILDWICGPEPPTLADRRREAENERLQRMFPTIDIDGKGRSSDL
jgi:CheY-like chemotaxis protein